MAFSANELRESLLALTPASSRGYAVAVSGGPDSAALLAAISDIRPMLAGVSVRAIHVNHRLQPAAAGFAEGCRHLCERFGVPLTVIEPILELAPGRSIEEVAREARYAALGEALVAEECLLTAHHQLDQAETFLLQALRGAGVRGLSAMPAARRMHAGWHLRPLLNVTRADLAAFVDSRGIPSLDDAMNGDPRFDRAFVRQTVWPALAARWPAAAEVLARAATNVASAQEGIRGHVHRDLAMSRDGDALSVSLLRRLPLTRQLEVLRAFVEAAAARPPPRARLIEGLRQMLDAGEDRQPVVRWSHHALRRHRGRIHLTPARIGALVARNWDIRATTCCELGAGLGRLVLRPQAGGLNLQRLPAVLSVCGRNAATRRQRHLFQELGVVPWMRDAIPFVQFDGNLVAVADLWRDARLCVDRSQPGVSIHWEAGPPIF